MFKKVREFKHNLEVMYGSKAETNRSNRSRRSKREIKDSLAVNHYKLLFIFNSITTINYSLIQINVKFQRKKIILVKNIRSEL